MAKLLFKKGTYNDFKNNVVTGNKAVEGAFYVTEDEGGLYLGVSDGKVKRVQGSVLFYDTLENFTKEVAPPYSTDVLYFIAEEEALVRWTGEETKWKQLNATASDVTTSLNNLQRQIDSVNKTAGDALPKAGGTMTGDINMGSKKITNLATPTADTDAATKKYVDDGDAALLGASTDEAGAATIHGALKAAQNAQTTANTGVTNAGAAQTSADKAQKRADAAYNLADTKTTMSDVEAKGYATTTEAQGYANAVQGTAADASTVVTVYGARALANQGIQDAAAAQRVADAAVKRAGDTMTGTLNMGSNSITNLADPSKDKDAATKKYVDDAKDAALAASEVVQGNVNTLGGTVDGINTRLGAVESTIGSHTTELGQLNSKNSSQDTAIAAAQKTADDAATAAGNANTNANNRVLQTDFNDFKNTTYANAISGINSRLTATETVANGALQRAGGDVTGTINLTGNGKITNVPDPTANGDATNKKYVDDGVKEAKDYADAQIAANDAMTFIDVLTKADGLPITADSANVGDTYKVGAQLSYIVGVDEDGDPITKDAKIGDLFINNASSDASVPNWVHISSGYEDKYLQKLKVTGDTIFITDGVNETYNNVVEKLKLGTVTVVGDASTNVKVDTEIDTDSNITVTVSMEWGSFAASATT